MLLLDIVRDMRAAIVLIYSCSVVVDLVALCSAGTIQNRPPAAVQTGQIQPGSGGRGGKSSPNRVMHEAFANAGQIPGLEIWRIENFKPVLYPKDSYGKFFSGDSYIVLNTVEGKDKKLSWDVHFWLGAQTSADEAGAAAILTVQLDDLLNGGPVQHREVQDHESERFLSYFKNVVRYEDGGVGTGFKHVETNAPGAKRLFQVKGKRNVRVRQVFLSVSSMNKGDCFILDAGNKILVYVGDKAKNVEKLKASSVANQIRDQDHSGRAVVSIIDQFSTERDKQNFFDTLGSGSISEVPAETAAEDDGAFEMAQASSVALYNISDSSGSLKVDAIATKPLTQSLLSSKECFILDTGSGSGIFVWVGKGATDKEKSGAMKNAQIFLAEKKYPAWTQIHRIIESAEPALFKQYFATWRDNGMSATRLIRSAMGYDLEDNEVNMDDVDSVVRSLKKSGGRAFGFMPDNGQNQMTEIVKYEYSTESDEVIRNVLPNGNEMPLLGTSAYVITYPYTSGADDSGTIIYVWQGSNTPDTVRESSFGDATEKASNENAILVYTTQNHEPRHFLKMFKGKLLTLLVDGSTGSQLFRIRGTNRSDVHVREVACDSSSLSSKDVFALVSPRVHKTYIWLGSGASELESEMAKQRFANYMDLGMELKDIAEGAEPDDFWEDLNGEGIYDRSLIENGAPLLEPRLFHCVLSGDRLKSEEVANFEQMDLDVDDIMLLDGGDEIYIWVGSGATAEENDKIGNIVKKYMKMEPTERSMESVTFVRVTQDHEPRVFKRMFPNWEDGYWQVG